MAYNGLFTYDRGTSIIVVVEWCERVDGHRQHSLCAYSRSVQLTDNYTTYLTQKCRQYADYRYHSQNVHCEWDVLIGHLYCDAVVVYVYHGSCVNLFVWSCTHQCFTIWSFLLLSVNANFTWRQTRVDHLLIGTAVNGYSLNLTSDNFFPKHLGKTDRLGTGDNSVTFICFNSSNSYKSYLNDNAFLAVQRRRVFPCAMVFYKSHSRRPTLRLALEDWTGTNMWFEFHLTDFDCQTYNIFILSALDNFETWSF
jgi:hypothetical protein